MNVNLVVNTLKNFKTKEAKIKFTKKNGEVRIMKCTLDFTKIPSDKKPKGIKLENILTQINKGNLRVFDTEIQEWRTIPVNSIEYIHEEVA